MPEKGKIMRRPMIQGSYRTRQHDDGHTEAMVDFDRDLYEELGEQFKSCHFLAGDRLAEELSNYFNESHVKRFEVYNISEHLLGLSEDFVGYTAMVRWMSGPDCMCF